MKVLYIDDTNMQHKLIGYYLRHGGNEHHQMISSFDGRDGIEKAQKEQPDAIILDLDMPGMSGEDTLKALKCSGTTISIPIIVYGKNDDPAMKERLVKLGAAAYVRMPDEIMEIKPLLNKLIHPDTRAM